MPRPREYDEREVLDAAMHVFWEYGLTVSTRRLAEAMDINPYSVYASFQSKANLFARALEHYVDTVESSILLPLLSGRPGIAALRQFLETFVNTKQGISPNGCLICNTMVEDAGHSESVLRTIQRYRELVDLGFTRALTQAFPAMPDPVVQARSEFFYAALMGLFVQKKMGIDGAPIQTLVDEIMAAVERDYD